MSTIDEIYEAVGDDAAYARLPAVLAAATGARSAIAIELDGTMQAQAWVRHAVSDDIMARYAELELWRHDLWSQLMGRPTHRNGAVRSDEVIDAQTFRESVFFNELYRPLGDDTARCLGVVLDRPGGSLAIGLHRAFGQPTFEEAELAALQDVVPHLRRLLAVRARLRQAEDQVATLTAAFDEIACGVLILGPEGQLRHANRAAEIRLQSRDGVALVRGRVAPLDLAMAANFAEAIRSAASGTAARGGAMRLRRPLARPLRLLVTPMPGPAPGALVIVDDDESTRSMTQVLATLFDLTEGEAEVADLLRRGLSPQEVAAKRDVRLSTVRSQIQSLLGKTEARSLGDLLRMLGRISGV